MSAVGHRWVRVRRFQKLGTRTHFALYRVYMPVASGRTPYRPKRWSPSDGFWDKAESGIQTADGHLRLGTNREILSWPGVEPTVRTEADEAEAQARLKKDRDDVAALIREQHEKRLAKDKERRARQDAEFAARQAEHLAMQEQQRQRDKAENRKALQIQARLREIEATQQTNTAALFVPRSPPSSPTRTSRTDLPLSPTPPPPPPPDPATPAVDSS